MAETREGLTNAELKKEKSQIQCLKHESGHVFLRRYQGLNLGPCPWKAGTQPLELYPFHEGDSEAECSPMLGLFAYLLIGVCCTSWTRDTVPELDPYKDSKEPGEDTQLKHYKV
nr:uncharacterized protein LOC101413553 isoform X6 [Dasypus novemcinctus]